MTSSDGIPLAVQAIADGEVYSGGRTLDQILDSLAGGDLRRDARDVGRSRIHVMVVMESTTPLDVLRSLLAKPLMRRLEPTLVDSMSEDVIRRSIVTTDITILYGLPDLVASVVLTAVQMVAVAERLDGVGRGIARAVDEFRSVGAGEPDRKQVAFDLDRLVDELANLEFEVDQLIELPLAQGDAYGGRPVDGPRPGV